MTAMPIAASIMSKKKIGYTVNPLVDPKDLATIVTEGAVHFNVNVASDLYWRGSQNDYSLKSDFGPLRLPFPTMWMEWVVPSEVIIHGKPVTTESFRVGCMLREFADGDGYRIGFTRLIAAMAPGSTPYISPVGLAFNVNENGQYVGDAQGGISCRFLTGALDKKTAEDHRVGDMCHLHVACLALNLMSCKNVSTEVGGVTRPRRGTQKKRRKEPRIEYRTIKLPGSPSGGEATGENEGIMPFHRVRGHFKKFTDNEPLFGKYTGTYWWGWQMRGKKSNGEIISDYLLRESV